MKRFIKYAWALATAALLLAGFYQYWYFLGAVGSGAFWFYVYYYKGEYT